MTVPSDTDLRQKAAAEFGAKYGNAPDVVAFAPGRVNLLGEHTDYNGGFVLPMPLELGVSMAVGRGGEPGTATIGSDQFRGDELRRIGEGASGAWSDYVLGSLSEIAAGALEKTGIRVVVAGNLPVGAGLSSSAAVEVCALRAAAELFGIQSDPVTVARIARAVENDFVGMPCGIMDQFAVSVGSPGNALFLDTRSLEWKPAPLPDGHKFVVIHSGTSHKLTDDGYATRVAECNAACDAMGVSLLSDLGPVDLERLERLDPPLDRRARHVITENRRVLAGVAALDRNDPLQFASLMSASHVSQRDDYEVSVPEVDALVQGVLSAGALGARLTGGGFGGSVVALVADERVQAFCARIPEAFPESRVLAVT